MLKNLPRNTNKKSNLVVVPFSQLRGVENNLFFFFRLNSEDELY